MALLNIAGYVFYYAFNVYALVVQLVIIWYAEAIPDRWEGKVMCQFFLLEFLHFVVPLLWGWFCVDYSKSIVICTFVLQIVLFIVMLLRFCRGRSAGDDDTFAYIAWRYSYPRDDLMRQLAPYGFKRFPVAEFEAQLTVVAGADNREAVDAYLQRKRPHWDRVRRRLADLAYQADELQYNSLFCISNAPHVCSCPYEPIRQMKLAQWNK